jgi:beta-xylosidase
VYCNYVGNIFLIASIMPGLSTLVISLGLCIAPCLSIRQNPLIPGFNPDPSPVYVDGWYYLATSSFEYFPGIPIYRSRDLSNWDLFSHALTRPSQLQLYGTPTSGGKSTPGSNQVRA